MPGAEHRPPAREPALRRPGRLPVPEPSGGERAWGGREGDKKGGGGAKRREAEGRAFCRPRHGREGAALDQGARGSFSRKTPAAAARAWRAGGDSGVVRRGVARAGAGAGTSTAPWPMRCGRARAGPGRAGPQYGGGRGRRGGGRGRHARLSEAWRRRDGREDSRGLRREGGSRVPAASPQRVAWRGVTGQER